MQARTQLGSQPHPVSFMLPERRGQSDPGRKHLMDPRFDHDAQTTGTLPGIGAGALNLSGGASSRPAPPAWVEETRAGITTPGRYVAFAQDDRIVVSPVTREWTRIGRSLAADIRFDDGT